ncbi:MAG: LamG domain-containing protein [Planctomycetota bacterium]|jgi:hypothetical protein
MCKKVFLVVFAVLLLVSTGRAWGLEELLRVDLGRHEADVAEGYVFIGNDASSTAEPFIVADVNGTGIDVILETTYAGNYLGFRTELAVPLYGSLVHVNDWFGEGIILTLGGLSPGTYSMESYHNNVWTGNPAPVSNLDILVNEQPVLQDVQQSRSETGPFGSALFLFTVPAGEDSAEIKFLPTHEPVDGWDNTALNGFILYSGAAAQVKASEPDPDNQSEHICPEALVLSWKPGDFADKHDIYFGSSLSDVNESASPVVANHDSNSWSPPSPNLGTTYYWRIDEVNDTDTWEGDIWWFVTQTGKAYDPEPVDDERGTPSGDTELSWTASCLASSHNVYFGTAYDDVNDATTSSAEYQDNVSETTYTVSTEPYTQYYWRIDEVGAATYKGDVWMFRTGVGGLLVWYDFDGTSGNDLPSPITDSTGNVTFTKHVDAVNPGLVEYASPNPVYNSASGTSADFSPQAAFYRLDPCAPGELDILRLDGYRYTIEMWVQMDAEPSDDDYALIEKDDTWSIGINDDRLVEWWHAGDDGRYNVVRAVGYPLTVGQWHHVAAVFDFAALPRHKLYLDGGLVASRDACINNYGVPLLNPADNNAPVGIGCRARGDPDDAGRWFQDFFDGKIDELRIYDVVLKPGQFLTVPGPEWASNPDPYNGQRTVDPNASLSWTPGTDAASHDVYFGTSYEGVADATTSSIEYQTSLGVEANSWDPPGAMEYGTKYYWRIDEVNNPIWKGMVWGFTTEYEIVDPNLILWYAFDETEGITVTDHSGYERHGELDGDANWEPNDGWYDGCLRFDDDVAVVPPYGMLEVLSSEVSVSVWLYGATQQGERDNWVLDTGGGYYYLQVKVPDASGDVYLRAGNDSNDVLVWEDAKPQSWIGFWHHLAFVKDEDPGQISIYFDGELADSNGIVDSTLANFENRALKIGAKLTHGSDYEGKMDDFRIYDRALTPAEVQALFRGGDLELAWAPDPFNGEQEVHPATSVIWKPGDFAAEHDVYFGTDLQAVTDANTSQQLGVYIDRQGPNSYDPGGLELDTTYYWRIDEVNDPCLWKGRVWKFTVANYVLIDDFESYNTADNRIEYTWEDGQENGTGSYIDLGIEPFSPAHDGDQSMMYIYDNVLTWFTGRYWSEVKLPFEPAMDWTDGGVKVLTLYFYGDPDNDVNDTEQLYVGLTGSVAEVRYTDDAGEDMNDLKLAEWTEWNIPISDFNSPQVVDPCAVTGFLIGFGDRNNTDNEGGYGVAFFDDIRLYQPRCVPEFTKPQADLNSDCIVSWGDIAVIGIQWLRSDLDLNPVTNPGDANLVGHWELEDNADDSSGNAYHGTAEGDYAWVAGKVGSGAIDLDGGWVVVEDNGNTPKLRPTEQVSATAWIYLDGSGDYRVVIKGENDEETFGLEVNNEDGLAFIFRDANNPNDVVGVTSGDALAAGEWIHVAGTYDANEQTCYVNGVAEHSETRGALELLADANDGMGIGGRYGDSSQRFDGKIDDVRVYDRGLTRAEVAYLASEGTGQVLLDSEANLFSGESPEVINISDLAVVLNSWLEQKLWP